MERKKLVYVTSSFFFVLWSLSSSFSSSPNHDRIIRIEESDSIKNIILLQSSHSSYKTILLPIHLATCFGRPRQRTLNPFGMRSEAFGCLRLEIQFMNMVEGLVESFGIKFYSLAHITQIKIIKCTISFGVS
jgi:hypothetical protein